MGKLDQINDGLAAANEKKRKLIVDQKEEHSQSLPEGAGAGASPGDNTGEESTDMAQQKLADQHSPAVKKARVSVRIPCDTPYVS